jgi:hypothetical protein
MKKNNYFFYGIFGMAILLLLLNFSYNYEGYTATIHSSPACIGKQGYRYTQYTSETSCKKSNPGFRTWTTKYDDAAGTRSE